MNLLIHGGAETALDDSVLRKAYDAFQQTVEKLRDQQSTFKYVIAASAAMFVLECSICKCQGQNAQILFTDGKQTEVLLGLDHPHPAQCLLSELINGELPQISVGCYFPQIIDFQHSYINSLFCSKKEEQKVSSNFDTVGLLFMSEEYRFAVTSTKTRQGRVSPTGIPKVGFDVDFLTTGLGDNLLNGLNTNVARIELDKVQLNGIKFVKVIQNGVLMTVQ